MALIPERVEPLPQTIEVFNQIAATIRKSCVAVLNVHPQDIPEIKFNQAIPLHSNPEHITIFQATTSDLEPKIIYLINPQEIFRKAKRNEEAILRDVGPEPINELVQRIGVEAAMNKFVIVSAFEIIVQIIARPLTMNYPNPEEILREVAKIAQTEWYGLYI